MPEPALQQRRRDIFRNFMTINALGKACPLPADHRLHGFWRLRFVHVLEEFSLRFGHSPGGMDSDLALGVYFPNPHSKRLLAGRAAVAGRVFEDGRYLFKFGKRHHLESMLHGGELRIAPASSYSDASFNNAVRDNELDREFWIHDPTNEDLRPYSHGRTARIPSKGSAIWVRSSEDYWLYCLSATYDPAMYDDFDCNACLVINQPIEFRERLLWHVHSHLGARGHAFSAVTYVDQLTQVEEDVPIVLQKDVRHAYQDEVRAAWLPPLGTKSPSAAILALGSLESIAELITVD